MNWEAISAFSDFFAAIAVIVTLAYLAVQIRQNTRALKSAATQGAHEQSSALYDQLADDNGLADIFYRGLDDPESLSREEMARLFAFLLSTLFRFQNWYYQTRNGVLDPELFDSWAKILSPLSGLPGYQFFWEQRRHMFAPELVAYLETRVYLKDRDPDYRPLGVNLKPGDRA